MYDFQAQLQRGASGEQKLDRYFARWFAVLPVGMNLQRLGIDRVFVRLSDGQPVGVEYKTDATAGRTGNAFVETVSVDSANKRGWAYTSLAQLLVYYVPAAGQAYWTEFPTLRQHLTRWCSLYPTRTIPNKGYNTIGLVVPLSELGKASRFVFPVP